MNGIARTRRARAGLLAAVVLATAAGACVHVDPAPNGVASVRLDAAPPSIALGDSLRDSLGNAYRVHGVAYDASGRVDATAVFQYSYVPFTPDTTAGAVADTALFVDAATGAVRAASGWLTLGNGTSIKTGRVFARVGSSIQIADTIQIVPPPDSLIATADTVTLRFDCTDPRTGIVLQPDTNAISFYNAIGPFTVVVKGDSAGTSLPVPRWLVHWSVDSAPAPIPTVTLATGRTVPAIAFIPNGGVVDQVFTYDTTDATGTSKVLLRIRPPALGKTYVADTLFRVTLRADVIVGRGQPVTGSPSRVFSVLLSRNGSPPAGTNAPVTCQR